MYSQELTNTLPGIGTTRQAENRAVWLTTEGVQYAATLGAIDGAKARDLLNTGDINVLRAGLLLGKITATGKYGAAVLGLTTAALAQNGTTLTVSAATAVEIVRRIGTTGTLTITGPATAGGVVTRAVATYSAVNTTSGDITISALAIASDAGSPVNVATSTAGVAAVQAVSAVNEVRTVTTAGSLSGGTFAIKVGALQTAGLAYTADQAAIRAACDAVFGASGVVVTGTLPSMTLTFSGTGYSGRPITEDVEIPVLTTLTGCTGITMVRTTPGVSAVQAVSAVNAVQTITLVGSPTSGTFSVAFNGESTPQLAYNVSAANMQAALRALTTIGAGNVTVTLSNSVYTVTFISTLAGAVQPLMEVDSSLLGGGSAGAFVSGSLVGPTDGSETIRTFVDVADGIRVTFNSVSQVVEFPRIPVAGQVDVSAIVNYPADAALKAYVKASLNTYGRFIFSDNL